MNENELYHHGIKGQKWGVRRYQNKDGSLTPDGVERYRGKPEYRKKDGSLTYAGKRLEPEYQAEVSTARIHYQFASKYARQARNEQNNIFDRTFYAKEGANQYGKGLKHEKNAIQIRKMMGGSMSTELVADKVKAGEFYVKKSIPHMAAEKLAYGMFAQFQLAAQQALLGRTYGVSQPETNRYKLKKQPDATTAR